MDKIIITLSIYFWNLHADQTIKDYRKILWSLANLICLWFVDRKRKKFLNDKDKARRWIAPSQIWLS